MNLYELSNNYKIVEQMLDNEEVDTKAIYDTLESIQSAIDDKVDSVVKIRQERLYRAENIDKEIKRLQALKKAEENKADWLKGYLEDTLNSLGMRKLVTPTFTVSIQKNAPSLKIDSEEFIPKDFWEAQEPKLSKKMLLSAMKAGLEIEGVTIQQTESLRVR